MSSSQRRILMIGWEYPPHNSGGLGVACEGLTQALVGANTQIYFTLPFALDQSPEHMQVLTCSDSKWFKHNSKKGPPFGAYPTAQSKMFDLSKELDVAQLRSLPHSELEQRVERYSELVARQAEKIKDKFDVVHAHDWMSFPAAERIKKKTGKPMVAHIHSTEFDRIPDGNGSKYIVRTEYHGMQIADHIIAVSYYTKNLLVKKYQINPKKVSVVHNGLYLKQAELSQVTRPVKIKKTNIFAAKRPVIVFMGRLTMQKGAEYFIEVARKVLVKVPEALFVLAGSGDIYHELLLRSAGKKLSASVLFSGFVRDKQKEKLLKRADVFIMPSLSEPFGLVALEAARARTPVIVSKNSGVSEVMKSSVVVDFWDVNKMSEEVLKLLLDKHHWSEVVCNQLKDLTNVTWEKSAGAVKKVYDRTFS